jgi:hypothetical protein
MYFADHAPQTGHARVPDNVADLAIFPTPEERPAATSAVRSLSPLGRGLGSYALGLALDTKNLDVIQTWNEDSP